MTDTVKSLTTPSYEPHPIANEDRMMLPHEFEGLKASIATNGLHHSIKLYEGKILDGRNRMKAALAIGYKFKPTDFFTFIGTPAEAKKYADDLNLHRRHLTADDKEKRVRRMLEDHPERSNRKIAELCGVSHTTVGKLRNDEVEDDREFEKFSRDWQNLSDEHRERFVEKFASELASVATS